VTSPQCDILIVASRSEQFVFRMCCKTPQLPAVTENDLIKATLQRALKDVVARGAHVDVAIVAARPLWVNRANATRILGKLKMKFKI
jgi:hypothetical protein